MAAEKSGDINFVDAQGQLTLYSVVGVGRNFKVIQACMYVLVTCKYGKNRIQNC